MKAIVLLASTVVLMSTASTAFDDHQKNKEQRKQIMQQLVEVSFKERDLNGDGTITYAEMQEKAGKAFKKLDKNKDGGIDYNELPSDMSNLGKIIIGEEVTALRQEMRKKRQEMKQKNGKERGDQKGQMRGKQGWVGKMTRARVLAMLDRDGDEKISIDEMMRPGVRKFKRADMNGDGSITKEEVAKAMKKMAMRMKRSGKDGMRKRARQEFIKEMDAS